MLTPVSVFFLGQSCYWTYSLGCTRVLWLSVPHIRIISRRYFRTKKWCQYLKKEAVICGLRWTLRAGFKLASPQSVGLLIIIDWLTLLNLNITVQWQKPPFKAPWKLSAIIPQITFLVFPIVTRFVPMYSSSKCGGISSNLSPFHANNKGNTRGTRPNDYSHLARKHLCEAT